MYLFYCRRGFLRPTFTLFYPCAVWGVTMLGVAGILRQQLAGNIGTFPAMNKSLILTAHRHGTFPVERISVSLYAASAAAAFLVLAASTVQSAS